MDSKPNQSESLNKPTPEERESKVKKKCYGQFLILTVITFITFQYYIFTYEIMWKTTTSTIMN